MNTNTVSDPLAHILTKPKTLLVGCQSLLIGCLVLIWALSPLGSQGTLRLVHPFNSTTVSRVPIRYWDSGPLGNMWPYSWSCYSNDGGYPVSMRDTYLAALMQGLDVKKGPRDQWGNVKIPRLIDQGSSRADPDGWFPAPEGDVHPEQYSSLSGIPIIGLVGLHKENVNFTVETSYVELACSDIAFIDNPDAKSGLSITCSDCGSECISGFSERTRAFLGPPFHGLTTEQQSNASIVKPRSMLFNSTVLGGVTQGIIQVSCQVTQRVQETSVKCIGNDCAATKFRPSRTDHRSENYTSFDLWGRMALDLISRSTVAENKDQSINGGWVTSGPSTSELFLNDSNVVPNPSTRLLFAQGDKFNISSVNIDLFAARASTLLNTALQVFMCPSCFEGNFPSNLSFYGPGHLPADGLEVLAKKFNWTTEGEILEGEIKLFNENIPFMAASNKATVTSRAEVYRPSYIWIGLLVGSVSVAFILGVSGLCLRFATITPDVFDPVIGLSYSNKYMPSTSVEGVLSSDDRVKSAGSERVRLGAVEPKDSLARLMFGEEAMIGPVNKETWYYESNHG